MRKIFFTAIILFLCLGQVLGKTYPQGTPIFADIHSCGNWISESSTTGFRLWYGDGESDYEDIYGTNIAIGSNLYYAIVERDDVIKIQLMRMKNDHSETWNYSPISTVEEGKDVIVMTESEWSWTCSWQTSTTFYVTPSTLSYDNSASWDAEKTLYANIQVGASEYVKLAMESDGHNYSGAPIYKTTFYSPFGGVHRIQFQVYDGEDFKGEKIFVKTDPEPDWSHSECLTNISNKIYNGTSWLTYGRDITIYAIPEAAEYTLSPAFDVSTHVLLANVKIGSTGDGEWLGVWPVFEKTAYQYNQKWIYKATVFAKYNVICRMQFHEKESVDGDTKSYYDYNPASEVSADDIDGKIFGGWVSGAHTWYDYAPDTYTVGLHPNGGSIWEGSVGSYTFGVGATLPTNVTKWGYDFAGWYDNAELEGDPVTAITTSDSGNKNYYAKWTSIVQEYPIASHPEFLAAQEGDIITVNVTGVHTSADIYLQYTNGTTITHRSISSADAYTFQLSADAAAEIRTNGLLVTGQNFTFSDVDILYRKTIWTGSLSDNTGWAETAVEKSIFSGLSGGDFLGFNISAINDGETWHQYGMRADYDGVISGTRTEAGIAIHQLSAADITAITDSNRIDITAQYLDISNLYSYTDTRVYTVEEHTNGGRIWADSVGGYTFGVGATLPTNVTKWNHNFGGWYANSSFDGEPVTTITTTDTGNKEYYAKWTSILKEYPVASHPELLTAQEGDIIVVNVTSMQTSSTIYLYGLDYSEIEHRDIASTGKHVFQLSAAAATNLRNYGFFVAGNNFTFDDVEIRYRKTIWTGPLNAEDDWEEEAVGKSIFSGLSEGDFLGFDISKINTGGYHQYSMRADYDNVLAGSCTETGIAIHQLSAADITALTDSDRIDIVAQYLEIAHLYAYSGIFVIYRTGDALDGGIETFAGGTIDSPIEYRMKVHTLDQWYSLYLPFTVDAIKVIEDGIYYDIQPYYRSEVGGTLYQGHYFIRTPAKTEDFEIANFSDWRDPDDYVFTPAGKTPYVIRWHDSYFLNKYISFFGHTDAAIPETMTVGDRPTKDSVVNVYGNDAMISGSVEDGYTLEPDYGNGSWLREETIGASRTVLPFECYLRANDKTTPIFKALRRTEITTGIDPISYDPSATANKVLINGQVVIIKDNKMYNVLGIEIQ